VSPRFVEVAGIEDIAESGRLRVEVEGERISLFHAEGEYFAIKDTCPHKKTAPLIRGALEGQSVKCPNHGFRFDLRTGACNVSEELATRVYPVRVIGGRILIGLPADAG
jgi:nitrite reductase/ring-hydroxylating ferredoxin subunit